MKKILLKSLVLIGSFVFTQVHASLMVESYGSNATPAQIGGYEMTDFIFDNASYFTTNTNSPISDMLSFEDKYGNALNMEVGSADNLSWWANNEGSNYNTYTTEVHWLKIILPKNTLAFSFDVGANTPANGWLTATDSDGFGITNVNNGVAHFNVNPANSPAFGIYADNSNATQGNCSYVSSVIVDPPFVWGVGNFSIAQGNCSATVPEPSMIALMSFGLIGLGVVARRKTK